MLLLAVNEFAVNEFNDVFKIESLALSPSLLNDSVEPSKSTDKVEPPPPPIPLPCDNLRFSEPSGFYFSSRKIRYINI